MVWKLILTNCFLFAINTIPSMTLPKQPSFVTMSRIEYLQQGVISPKAQTKKFDNGTKPGGDGQLIPQPDRQNDRLI